jgi:hypothetical protein
MPEISADRCTANAARAGGCGRETRAQHQCPPERLGAGPGRPRRAAAQPACASPRTMRSPLHRNDGSRHATSTSDGCFAAERKALLRSTGPMHRLGKRAFLHPASQPCLRRQARLGPTPATPGSPAGCATGRTPTSWPRPHQPRRGRGCAVARTEAPELTWEPPMIWVAAGVAVGRGLTCGPLLRAYGGRTLLGRLAASDRRAPVGYVY